MDFWSQFWPQLIATIIGIAIGIPVALWISGFQERQTEKERKEKILFLIRRELNANEEFLEAWKGSESKLRLTSYIPAYLRDETWKSFSDSGELKWIKDPELIHTLSSAYYLLRAIIYFASKQTELNLQREAFGEVTHFDRKYSSELEINIDSFLSRTNRVREFTKKK